MRWFLRSGLRRVILVLVIVAFLWFVPQLQGEYFSPNVPDKERAALVNEYRRTWAQIIGGFGLLLGLYLTWQRIEISQRELEATRDQQVTERFTRAIDQLGAITDKGEKKLEIRLGGIYALERIAVDSFATENSPGRDYSTVMEVLTAYVRENAPQAAGPSAGSSDAASPLRLLRRWLRSTSKQPAPPELRDPTADIQAIMDVLRRTQDRVPVENRIRLDLHEANLQLANLYEIDLQEANLYLADLRAANFYDANLQGALLNAADLRQANLRGANLRGARLEEANLRQAVLHLAELQEANLQGADLREVDLRETFLREASLRGANLRGAKVRVEQLEDTLSLQGATMPDGQEYEDWLKDKEGSGKDMENE